jgi:hypothetical protein
MAAIRTRAPKLRKHHQKIAHRGEAPPSPGTDTLQYLHLTHHRFSGPDLGEQLEKVITIVIQPHAGVLPKSSQQ